ncbi:Multifunctional CCA protein [Frankliniella fusca]|uniref:Multifunctional CCA protein n=1 Tax=Frankliniella fusca TaxID=407009 RepID=A0AAE1HA82_9NEOP|nr:Multifunctional CCA protein [Frankliniella fusca]
MFKNSPQFSFHSIVNFLGAPAPAADAEVAGCLFRFGQAQWRSPAEPPRGWTCSHLPRAGNEAMRTDFHALIALAFASVDDVEDSFGALADVSVLALQPILKHLEDNYIRGRLRARRGGRVGRRTAPLFPPELYNCYERTLAGLPRTTNTCEAWHRCLSSLGGKHHPSFFVFLGQLREEEAEIDIRLRCHQPEGHWPQSIWLLLI